MWSPLVQLNCKLRRTLACRSSFQSRPVQTRPVRSGPVLVRSGPGPTVQMKESGPAESGPVPTTGPDSDNLSRPTRDLF